ncbi:ABC transporter permease subunit [Lactococcus hircilactis]|uniref:ABC transporter permease subunit n=1 Tax=Lactococcus hircilactis TaxID=1494462 RepID=A0A7X1ZA37_9LACT|nr:ABC transporter permease subunit [Lactococcus hircilactis]
MTTQKRNGKGKNQLFTEKLKHNASLYLLLAPATILLIMFAYIPMYGLLMAFKDYSPSLGIWASPWVGLKWFQQYFSSYMFWPTIFNTLKIAIYGLLFGFTLPIILAVLCNQLRNQVFKKFFQVTTYLPHFISTMVMAGMLLLFLSPQTGLVANLLHVFNLKMPDIIANPNSFASLNVWSDVWQNIGWNSIIYLAALSAIDPTYYEAATMDGATRLQCIIKIDLPLLLPTIMIMLIMAVGQLLNVGFEKVLLLQNPLNLSGSEIISTYVYKVGLQSFQYSYSTAINLFQTVINLVILVTANFLSRRLTETGLF